MKKKKKLFISKKNKKILYQILIRYIKDLKLKMKINSANIYK
jgi:hypothetical protein